MACLKMRPYWQSISCKQDEIRNITPFLSCECDVRPCISESLGRWSMLSKLGQGLQIGDCTAREIAAPMRKVRDFP